MSLRGSYVKKACLINKNICSRQICLEVCLFKTLEQKVFSQSNSAFRVVCAKSFLKKTSYINFSTQSSELHFITGQSDIEREKI